MDELEVKCSSDALLQVLRLAATSVESPDDEQAVWEFSVFVDAVVCGSTAFESDDGRSLTALEFALECFQTLRAVAEGGSHGRP